MKPLSIEERARALAYQERNGAPFTNQGKKVKMQLTIACLAVQNIDRILRDTLYTNAIDSDIALALQALSLAEEALLDMELAQ